MPSTGIFSAHTFDAKPLSNARVRGFLLSGLQKSAKDALDKFEQITSTWDHEVFFTPPRIKYSGGDARIEISTDDEAFHWLDVGTNIRWAVMSNPFLPKTRPGGGYASNVGSGHAVIRGRTAMMKRGIGAQPGIEARDWTTRLAEETKDDIVSRVKDAIRQGTQT